MVASFDLPNATDSQVSGTHAGDDFGLKISSSKSIQGVNGTFDSAELNFGITNDQKSGYWTLTSLKVTFTGTFNGGQIAINGVDLDVHLDKTGLTKIWPIKLTKGNMLLERQEIYAGNVMIKLFQLQHQ